MWELAREDIRRSTYQESGKMLKLAVILFNLGLHAVLLYRVSRWLSLHHMQPVAVLISYLNSVVTGAQISPRATIGKGLVIYHPQGTVIGATAVIGNYCTLTHGNVIGQLYGGGDRPIIGDNFYAGTGAKILGKVAIGNNVHVGANAVVLQSLPDAVSMAAPPARILFRDGAAPYPANHVAPAISREAILQRLSPLLMSILDGRTVPDTIDETTGLLGEGLGLASIEILRLVGAVEEEFDLTIDDRELKGVHFRSVGSLVTFVQERFAQ